jgi:hypothetical protein
MMSKISDHLAFLAFILVSLMHMGVRLPLQANFNQRQTRRN